MRRNFLFNDDGATAIEYGLICAVLVLVMVVSLTTLGNNSTGLYGNTRDEVVRVTGK